MSSGGDLAVPAAADGVEVQPLARADRVALIGLTLVALVACFVDLGSRSLWNDEIGSALIATHHGSSLWSAVTNDGGNMALYYVLLHLVVAVLGDGQTAVRLLSATAGAALVPVMFFLGRRMFGRRTAVIATSIVAVSPALVVWSQQARGYSLATLLVAWSLLALLRALENPTWRRWLVTGLVPVLAIYTVVYAGLFLAAMWLPLLFWRPARPWRRHVVTIVAVGALVYVPLVIEMLRSGAAGVLSANGRPSLTLAVQFIEEFAAARAPELFGATVITGILTVVAVLCWIAGGAELLSLARSAAAELETIWLGVCFSWLFLPLMLDAAFSLSYRSIFEPSFLLQSVPAGALVVGFVLGKMLPRGVAEGAAAGVVALLVVALVPSYGVSYEQWGRVTRYVRAAARPGDCLTVGEPGLAHNVAYYFSLEGGFKTVPQLVLPKESWSRALNVTARAPVTNESFVAAASRCDRLWIVISRASTGQQVLIGSEISWFLHHGYRHLSVTRFVPKHGFEIVLGLISK